MKKYFIRQDNEPRKQYFIRQSELPVTAAMPVTGNPVERSAPPARDMRTPAQQKADRDKRAVSVEVPVATVQTKEQQAQNQWPTKTVRMELPETVTSAETKQEKTTFDPRVSTVPSREQWYDYHVQMGKSNEESDWRSLEGERMKLQETRKRVALQGRGGSLADNMIGSKGNPILLSRRADAAGWSDEDKEQYADYNPNARYLTDDEADYYSFLYASANEATANQWLGTLSAAIEKRKSTPASEWISHNPYKENDYSGKLARGKTMVDFDAFSQTDHGLPAYMSEDEQDWYAYTLGAFGQDEADAYYKTLRGELNRRKYNEKVENRSAQGVFDKVREYLPKEIAQGATVKTLSKIAGGIDSVRNTAKGVVDSVGGGIVAAGGDALEYIFKGEIDPYSINNDIQNTAEAKKRSVESKIQNPVMKTAYQIGTSVAETALITAVSMGIGSIAGAAAKATGDVAKAAKIANGVSKITNAALNSSRVFSGTVQGAIERGVDDDKAVALGLISAAVEGLTETWSLSKFLDDPANLLHTGISNATEEVSANILNTIADVVTTQEKSEWMQTVNAYMVNEHMSEAEAFSQALLDKAGEMGIDFVGGFVSGAALSAPSAITKASMNGEIRTLLVSQGIDKKTAGKMSHTLTKVAYGDTISVADRALIKTNPVALALYNQMIAENPAAQGVTDTDGVKTENTEVPVIVGNGRIMPDGTVQIAKSPAELAAWQAEAAALQLPQNENTAEDGGERYSIVVLENGNVYVDASRNVITGKTLNEQRNEVSRFFDALLSNRESLDIPTIEGDVLTITREETANKARDNYWQRDGKREKMSPTEFALKARVETHIDEIAEVSTEKKGKSGKRSDEKSHSFAKDGFTYRRAYFRDFDGQYYEITLSVGKNGDTATVYNVGKIEGSVLPAAKIIAASGSMPIGKTTSNQTISQPAPVVNPQTPVLQSTATNEGGNNNGTNVFDGNEGRPAGVGAGEQTGSVRNGTEPSGREARRIDQLLDRVARSGAHFQSTKSLGISRGTDRMTAREVAPSLWDAEMQEADRRVYSVTGKHLRFVVGMMEINGTRGVRPIKGVRTDTDIIVKADHPYLTPTKIALHEMFHELVAQYPQLRERAWQSIRNKFTDQQIGEIADIYRENLQDVYSTDKAITDEMLADAYAGINMFGANTTVFSGAVQNATDTTLGEGRTAPANAAPRAPPQNGGEHMMVDDARGQKPYSPYGLYVPGTPGVTDTNAGSRKVATSVSDAEEAYSLESKTQPGRLDPRTVTRDDVSELLHRVKDGEIYGDVYFPVRINTPSKLIYWAEKRRGDVIDNNPIAMSAEKAWNAMNRSGETGDGRPNKLSVDEIISMIEAMSDPRYIVYQSANERYVEVVEFDTSKGYKAFAVIEIGNHKDAVYMNGYEGGLYNIMVTTYPPEVGKLRELLNNKKNKIIYDKQKDAPQRTSSSTVPSVLNDASFYEDSISQSDVESKQNFSTNDSGEQFSVEDTILGMIDEITDEPSTEEGVVPQGVDVHDWEAEMNARAEEEKRKRLEIVSRKKFEGSSALQKLGIKVEGTVTSYEDAEYLRQVNEAYKQLDRDIAKLERRLGATAKEKSWARQIAGGEIPPDMIHPDTRKNVVLQLAEYYSYRIAMGENSIRRQKHIIIDRLDEQVEDGFRGVTIDNYRNLWRFLMNVRTPERILRRLFGDEKGAELYRLLFEHAWKNTVEGKTRFAQAMFDRVREFKGSDGKVKKLTKDERAAAQMQLEGRAIADEIAKMETRSRVEAAAQNMVNGMDPQDAKVNDNLSDAEYAAANRLAWWLRAQKWIAAHKVDQVRVDNAVEAYTEVYNELYDAINDFLTAHGYEPIGFIKGYAPHFQSSEARGNLKSIFENLTKLKEGEVLKLPASIDGLTSEFKPSFRWNPHMQHRMGEHTEYDIAYGFEQYIDHIADIFFHTDDVMRLRRAVHYIRTTYSAENISEELSQIKALRHASTAEKADWLREKKIMGDGDVADAETVSRKLDEYLSKRYEDNATKELFSNLVVWMDDYANSLAGKQTKLDRSAESLFGRLALNIGNRFVSIFARSNIAGNLSSAFNQLAQLPAVVNECGAKNVAHALFDMMMKNRNRQLHFDSDYITGKRGVKRLTETFGDKTLDWLFKPLELVDRFVSCLAVDARYYQNIGNGMDSETALQQADRFAANVMGSRIKGEKPQLFLSRNPLNQMLAFCQVEVMNTIDHYISDLPAQVRKVYKTKGKGAAAALVTRLALGHLILSYLLNKLIKWITGGTPAPGDFVGWSESFIQAGYADENEEEFNWERAFEELSYNFLNDIPFVQNFSAFMGWGDQTLPVPDAFGELKDFWDTVTKENEDGEDGKIFEVAESAGELIAQFMWGGRQIKKTFQGVQAMKRGGVYKGYGDNKKLQYPVDGTWDEWIRGVMYGKNALPETDDFYASGASGLSVKQTKAYEEVVKSGADRKTTYNTIQSIRSAKEPCKKRDVLEAADLTDQQKLVLYIGVIESTEKDGDDTSGREDEFCAMMDVGMSWSDVMAAYNKWAELNGTEGMKATAKATAFAVHVDAMDLTREQRAVVKTQLPFNTGMTVSAEKYEAVTTAGLSSEKAQKVCNTVEALLPEEGKTSVSSRQKQQAIVGMSLSEEEKMLALSAYMPESTYRKLEIVSGYDVTPTQWVTYFSAADKDESGNISKMEANMYLKTMTSLNSQQRAALWQATNAGWNPKSNPFNKSVSFKVQEKLKSD